MLKYAEKADAYIEKVDWWFTRARAWNKQRALLIFFGVIEVF